MSRALTFLEEVERDAASVSLSDRPTITPAALFPTRHVTRPRVVADPHEQFEWSVTGGKIKARHRSADRCWFVPAQCGHEGGGGFIPTAERVALWADLLANPTETVEAES